MNYETNSTRGYVYFLRSTIDGRRAIKIGKSWNPKLRAKTIRRSIAAPVELLAAIPFEDSWDSGAAERSLHERFKTFKLRGEWFLPVEPILSLILESQFQELSRG